MNQFYNRYLKRIIDLMSASFVLSLAYLPLQLLWAHPNEVNSFCYVNVALFLITLGVIKFKRIALLIIYHGMMGSTPSRACKVKTTLGPCGQPIRNGEVDCGGHEED